MAETEIVKSTILVVDDEEDHAQVMCEALSRLGHKCTLAYNLAEARESMGKKKFDVIVTDLMMDGRKDGLEVLRDRRTLFVNLFLPVLLYPLVLLFLLQVTQLSKAQVHEKARVGLVGVPAALEEQLVRLAGTGGSVTSARPMP